MASNSRESISAPRDLLVSWLSRLYDHRLTTTTGGNLSLVDDDGTMFITPSGGDKALVPPERIAFRRKGGTEFEGPSPPSMEWPLHVAAYEVRPDCKAVIHAHSMTLVAFSIAKPSATSNEPDPRLPDTRVLLGSFQACGKVALDPYALPGSKELADGCREALQKGADCVMLQNHGVVVVGKSLHQAYDRFVSLEYIAQSIVNAAPLGVQPKPLPDRILMHASDSNGEDSKNQFPREVPLSASFPDSPPRVLGGREKELRSKLCQFVRRAYRQNLITSSSGSFSVRLEDGDELSFLSTPTGVDRLNLEPSDLCFISSASKYKKSNSEEPPLKTARLAQEENLLYYPVHARRDPSEVRPSRAATLHGTIYAKHPEISCIMIVQPTFATAFCITGVPFNAAGIPESHIVLHTVQTLPIESALRDDGAALAGALDPSSGKNTVLVEGYGLVTVGSDLLKTFIQVEVCESMCGVTLTALRRGPTALLSGEQVQAIDKVFRQGH